MAMIENEMEKKVYKVEDVQNLLGLGRSKAYEFIENGQYYPVMRGISPLDKVKPRSEWKWGDIYVGSILTFSFSYIGIIIAGGDNYGEKS